MKPQLTLLVVSHTHWDREWYRTAEVFRQRLVRLMDELIDSPPPEGGSFLLDGQAILLDDYLEVRPERAAELSALLRSGQLEAGPWFVLADNLIPCGEALVRNLLVGRNTVQRLRGEPPPVLYCPDSFGHPAILPDLAAGFGCDLILVWRGLGGGHAPRTNLMRWTGAAGPTALVYHLPRDGYEFGSSLPLDVESARTRAARIVSELEERATHHVALLLNGADHHARQRESSAAITLLADAAAPARVIATSLRDAARQIADTTAYRDAPMISGELRDSYGYTWTLQGTLGTRAGQKRRNARAERRLVRDVEPWIALHAMRTTQASSAALLRATWKTLLAAHPHDTLCGTSIDAVAAAFDARLASVEAQSRELREHAVLGLIDHDAEAARAAQSDWRPVVVIRNPVARKRSGVAEITMLATIADIAVGPGSGARQGARRKVHAPGIAGTPIQVLSEGERIALSESPRAYPDADLITETRAVAWIDEIGGYAIQAREHGTRSRETMPNPVVCGERSLENGLLRVTIDDEGVIALEDLALGRRITNLLSFENHRDEGDLYTPAIRKAIRPMRYRIAHLVHRGPIRGEISIEYRTFGSPRRTADFCRVTLQLDADAATLRIIVAGENRSTDHRLRLRIATALPTSETFADAAFHPVRRVAIRADEAGIAIEHVVPTAPLHRWVARASAEHAVVIVSDGLAEYEALGDGSVSVTLVRAVGELSRSHLPERPGHAGWPAPVPDAQSIGAFEGRFAVSLLDTPGETLFERCHRVAEDGLLPIVGETLRSNLGAPRSASGVELNGDGLILSAIAPAQENGFTMLRVVNLRDAPIAGVLAIHGVNEACTARLDETRGSELTVNDSRIEFTAAPREIVTILTR